VKVHVHWWRAAGAQRQCRPLTRCVCSRPSKGRAFAQPPTGSLQIRPRHTLDSGMMAPIGGAQHPELTGPEIYTLSEKMAIQLNIPQADELR